MKVALYICLSLIVLNLLNSFSTGWKLEFGGLLYIIYQVISYLAYIGLSVLSFLYFWNNTKHTIIKVFLVFTNVIYVLLVSVVFIFYSLEKIGDLNTTFTRLDKSEQIILKADNYLILNSKTCEVYVFNLHPNFKVVKIFDSVELNGVWIKNKWNSYKIDTINYKNYIYKSEYNN